MQFKFFIALLLLSVFNLANRCQAVQMQTDWNGNGLSDIWEAAYAWSTDTASHDPDFDGQSNQLEAAHGTNPYDSQSIFRLSLQSNFVKARLLQWHGKQGRQYVVQSHGNSGWYNISDVLHGKGSDMSFAINQTSASPALYRILLPHSDQMPSKVGEVLAVRDTDSDGQSDWVEWLAGSSLIDQSDWFKLSLTGMVPYHTLRWSSMEGLDYYIETLIGDQWADFAGPFVGDGRLCEVIYQRKYAKAIYRLRSEAADRDGDGLLDWEEHLIGLDPNDANSGDPQVSDKSYVQQFLTQGGVVALTAIQPVLRVGESKDAVITLRRRDGFAPLNIPLIISGDAISSGICSTSPSIIELKLGQREAIIRIKFQEGITVAANSTISVSIPPSVNYSLDHFSERKVNIVNDDFVNVINYGAVGDGVTNDTLAIQSAIHAMEQNPAKSGLFFPAGTYRIATIITDNDSPVGSSRMLKLGNVNLNGRDILLKGAAGACLYSDPGTIRANLLLAKATFRTLTIDGLRFEKSPQPLSATPGHEPNGASGLAVAAQGNQSIEGVFIRNSVFTNCHSSVTLYGNGYDIRGYGGCFHMSYCQVLNPYGANTLESNTAFGGGQQIALSAWVADAIYENCIFDGGSEDLTDPATAPGGVLKDGCHFGCPLRLLFRNNVVKRMGVEAVFQTGGSTYMGATEEAFVMPPPDDITTASVKVSNHQSSYIIGQFLNIRSLSIPGQTDSNNRFTIRGYDPQSHTLTLSNPGLPGNLPHNTTLPAILNIYKDNHYEPTTATFEGNLIDGAIPPGGLAFAIQAGIASGAKSVVRYNAIVNFATGILNYDSASTPQYSSSRGLLAHDNLIVTRNAQTYPTVYTYGIQTFENAHRLYNNLIIAPVAWKTVGIGAYGGDTMAWNNTVVADQVAQNGYFSSFRAVGIGYGNQGFGFRARSNFTRGFDVGVGSMDAYSGIHVPYRMKEHKSIQDVLAFDPIGLLPW